MIAGWVGDQEGTFQGLQDALFNYIHSGEYFVYVCNIKFVDR